jgi:regulator of sirC expression with transglutaminase-like and TPR domain
MARDVFLRRAGGATAKVAYSDVADGWKVSRTMLEEVVRDYGLAAKEWLRKVGGDRDEIAIVIEMRATAFRELAIEREATKVKHSARRRAKLIPRAKR